MGRINIVRGVERHGVVSQRLRQLANQFAIAPEELQVRIAHGGVARVAIVSPAYTQIFNHRAGTEKIQAREKQLGIC